MQDLRVDVDMGIFFLAVWTLISGFWTALFVKCKPFRSFLVIPLSLDLSFSPGLYYTLTWTM